MAISSAPTEHRGFHQALARMPMFKGLFVSYHPFHSQKTGMRSHPAGTPQGPLKTHELPLRLPCLYPSCVHRTQSTAGEAPGQGEPSDPPAAPPSFPQWTGRASNLEMQSCQDSCYLQSAPSYPRAQRSGVPSAHLVTSASCPATSISTFVEQSVHRPLR